jgi:hypothetical protein
MALPSFDKQTDIPNGFEAEYEEVDGKWVPVDHAAKLSKALDEERKAREAAEAVAKKATKAAADAAAEKQAKAAGMTEDELKKLYDNIEANLRKEYEPKLVELESATKENRELKLNNVIKGMFSGAGAVASRVDDFWKLHAEEFDLTSDGKPMVRDEPGKDVAKHIAGIMKNRAEWVQGTKASGSGSGGYQSTTAPQSSGPLTFEDLVKNPAAGLAAANERG